jgi:hypothetical protein
MNIYQLLEFLDKEGPMHPARIVERKAMAAFTVARGYDAVTVSTDVATGKPLCVLTDAGRKSLDKVRADVAASVAQSGIAHHG